MAHPSSFSYYYYYLRTYITFLLSAINSAHLFNTISPQNWNILVSIRRHNYRFHHSIRCWPSIKIIVQKSDFLNLYNSTVLSTYVCSTAAGAKMSFKYDSTSSINCPILYIHNKNSLCQSSDKTMFHNIFMFLS